MKALFTLKPAIKKNLVIAVLLSFIPIGYPGSGIASTLQDGLNSALVFEVKNLNSDIETSNSISYNEIVVNDPLASKLKKYLESHKSPLAEYAPEIIQQSQWKRALAISWVESNYGRRCADNNCSGIGVAPGHASWRKYPTKLEWFKDMNSLLDKPIYQKYNTFRKMKGIYVYPGSENWVRGAEKKYAELEKLEMEALTERAELHKKIVLASANSGFVEMVTELE